QAARRDRCAGDRTGAGTARSALHAGAAPKVTKVRWGVLGVAGIAVKKVIPGMQRGTSSEIVAIASRDPKKARDAAASFGIPNAYGSYDELLADPAVEAVYIPLPNHLHAHWTARAAGAGKHVLCEKPIAMNMGEAETLLTVRDR